MDNNNISAVFLLVPIGLIALILLWVSLKLLGTLTWLAKISLKYSFYVAVWAIFVFLVWSAFRPQLPAELRIKEPSDSEFASGEWGHPKTKENILNVIQGIRSLGQGKTPEIFTGWGITKKIAKTSFYFTISSLKGLFNNVMPAMRGIEHLMWQQTFKAATDSTKGILTCGIPCAVSGIDCPDDAACLCEWRKTTKMLSVLSDIDEPTSYSSVWKPCREEHTMLPVGLCVCPAVSG